MKRIAYNRLLVFALLVAVCAPATVWSIGSKEKTPEERAAENEERAIAEYNDGVKKMQRGRELGSKADSTFAFNYRATSDDKARREYEKAAEKFAHAVQLFPKFKEAHNNLGYVYRKLGELEKSLASYQAAVALDTLFAQAREYRAETYLALGELAQAESELAWLKNANSAYADTLSLSIDLFKLQEIQKKLEK